MLQKKDIAMTTNRILKSKFYFVVFTLFQLTTIIFNSLVYKTPTTLDPPDLHFMPPPPQKKRH